MYKLREVDVCVGFVSDDFGCVAGRDSGGRMVASCSGRQKFGRAAVGCLPLR